LNNRKSAGYTKPFSANVSNRRPNYPHQTNTGYAAPRAETINLKTPNQNRIWLTLPTVLAWPGEGSRTAELPHSSRPVELVFEVDAKETNARVTSIKTRRQNETSADYLPHSPPTHTNQWTGDSLARDGKVSKFSRHCTSAWQQTMGRRYVNGSNSLDTLFSPTLWPSKVKNLQWSITI